MPDPHAIMVVDLAFGDCGKGAIVDFLTRHHSARLVVRFNGGPQAGHNVVLADGRHHTFSQFGSGTFVPDVRTLLSRFMLIEPYALLNEASHLVDLGVQDPMKRLSIDARCPVITPLQQSANRLRELARAGHAHGTCGAGVGEAMQDLIEHPHLMIRARDLQDGHAIRSKLKALVDLKRQQLREYISTFESHPAAQLPIQTLLNPAWIDAAVNVYASVARQASIINEDAADILLRAGEAKIFEGAQGVLLDENHGFHPHTTWSTTTFANAQSLLNESGFAGPTIRIGVLRTYFTRHGPGPFVTEDATLDQHLPEPHNNAAGFQGRFRVGRFDAVAARYALKVVGPIDALAITHLDRSAPAGNRICTAYQSEQAGSDWFIGHPDRVTDIKVRPTAGFAERERLTKQLNHCHPLYQTSIRSNEEFLATIEQSLQVPVAITSHGPTSFQKTIHPPLADRI